MFKPYADLTSDQIGRAVRAFRSEKCPGCSVDKISVEDPFCLECLELLTPELYEAVHDNAKFIEAFHPAMAHLSARKSRGREVPSNPSVSV